MLKCVLLACPPYVSSVWIPVCCSCLYVHVCRWTGVMKVSFFTELASISASYLHSHHGGYRNGHSLLVQSVVGGPLSFVLPQSCCLTSARDKSLLHWVSSLSSHWSITRTNHAFQSSLYYTMKPARAAWTSHRWWLGRFWFMFVRDLYHIMLQFL